MKTSSIKIIVGLVLFAACFFVYFNSFHNDFVWDDEHLVVNNPYIRDFKHIKNFFTSSLFIDKSISKSFYRPIQALTLAIDYHIWKLRPVGYHITNCFLHFCVIFLIYSLIMVLSGNFKLSIFTALFFAVHPIHTEAITYISGRADHLAAVFLLAGLICYIKSEHTRKFHFYVYALVFFILALFSRENALIFPFLLIIYDLCFRNIKQKGLWFKSYSLFFVIAGIYTFIRMAVLNSAGGPSNVISGFSVLFRFLTFLKIISVYIGLLIYPVNLHMERSAELVTRISDPAFLFSAGALIVVFLSMFMLWKKHRLVVFGILWFLITLLPYSNLIPLNAALAEHWLYLPSIGFFLVCSAGILRLSELKSFKTGIFKKAVFALFAIVLCIYGFLTIKQNAVWKNSQTLYSWVLKHSPDSGRVYFNLGNFYRDQGKYEMAAREYEKAIEYYPDYIEAYTNLASLYADKLNRVDKAFLLIKKVVELKPDSARVHYNLAALYNRLNESDKAVTEYKRAIELDNNYAEPLYALGVIFDKKGEIEEAVKMYKKAIRINPNYFNAHINLGTLYFQKEFFKEAEKEWKAALKIDPESKIALQNLKALERLKKS